MPLYDATPSYIETDVYTNRYLILVRKRDFFSPLTRLIGYALTAPNIDFSNPVTIPKVVWQNGSLFTTQKTVRGQGARMYTLTLGWPAGNWIMTPVGRLAENLSNCERDYFLLYLCPEDNCKAHFWVFPDSRLSPIEPGDLVTVGDDAAAIEATSQLYTITPWIYLALQGSLQQNIGEPLYGVDFCMDSTPCDDCEEPNADGIYGGRDVTGTAPLLEFSVNQFASGTDIAPPVGVVDADHFITSTYCRDGLMIITHADTADMATAVAGGIGLSINNGASGSWVAGRDISTGAVIAIPFKFVFSGNGYYWAIGPDNAVWRSVDALNWEEMANSAGTATTIWYMGAFDEKTGLIYLAGVDTTGPTSIANVISGSAFVDITSLVGAGAEPLFSVAVLDSDHVAFGDGGGFLHEHQSASKASATNAYRLVLTGTTSDVKFIGGDTARTIVGAGTSVYERSVLTNRDFRPMTLGAGTVLTGDIQAGATGDTSGNVFPGYNYFVVVTDDGEILMVKPCYTFANV